MLRQAVAARREQRYSTAAALARALDEVTLRRAGRGATAALSGPAGVHASGRGLLLRPRDRDRGDVEEAASGRICSALIGPSGAGKSSFLRAGLRPRAAAGVAGRGRDAGHTPVPALAQALAPEFAGDAEASQHCSASSDADIAVEPSSRWRRRHDHALLVLDQFEELFTQMSPLTSGASRNCSARLALEAERHVLVSLRDDFLFHCQRRGLAPMSGTSRLGPLGGGALRRALVQPALKCGYRFEDEAMVDEMLAEVAGERARCRWSPSPCRGCGICATASRAC